MFTVLASMLMVMSRGVGNHAREHGHAPAHVDDCESEPIHACVHGCERVCGNGNLSWVVLLFETVTALILPLCSLACADRKV
jgi:hypothetical protein